MRLIEEVGPTGKVYVRPEKSKKETASVKSPETATKKQPEPKHVGGGWYELADGKRVRKTELNESGPFRERQ